MTRALEELADWRHLGDRPRVHDGHAFDEAGHQGEVVGDPEDGHAETLLQTVQQLHDLRLDGRVERGGGLIGDQEARLAGDGHGGKNPLPLTPRELVRIARETILRVGNVDEGQKLDRADPAHGLAHPEVFAQALGQLPADGEDGVE